MSTKEENLVMQELYDEYQDALRRIAHVLQVPDMDVDDVVQETFIAYFRVYSQKWSLVYKKALLVKILKRKSIDCLRKYGRYETVSLDDENIFSHVELLTRYMMDDPADLVIGKETLARITGEIANMRQEWKKIAVLYFLEQKTISEICEILGISGTVCRSRIYRTRVCLKKILGPRYDI